MYFGGGQNPVIDVNDSTYGSGLFGLNVFSGTAVAQNATVG